jgi:nitroreductase
MDRTILLQILDLTRWAPSGDNTQPWRFQILAENQIAIHGHDTRADVIYDFQGHASHMAHGALLETLRLAATRFGLRAEWVIRPGQPDTAPIYDVTLHPDQRPEDPLVAVIQTRCVQRRPMSTQALSNEQKLALQKAVGSDYALTFFESRSDRFAVARLLWHNARLRLTCPEAYRVHSTVIEWNARYSKDRIPDQAVGVDPLTARLMSWVMQSWERVVFFNRYCFGTIAPRIQLDLLPGFACSAHILMRPTQLLAGSDPLQQSVLAGVALQRLWLTVAALGLHLQPEMTPVIFRWYVRAQQPISSLQEINLGAQQLAQDFENLTGAMATDAFSFFCRVGHSRQPASRSIRLDLADLMYA